MKQRMNLQQRRGLAGYLYISPFIVGLLIFNLFPFIFSFIMSLTDWDIFRAPHYIGFENYVDLFTKDPVFIRSLANTFVFMFFSMFRSSSQRYSAKPFPETRCSASFFTFRSSSSRSLSG
jgi:ABC-type sugar transport system permease subunit